jgi:hypothetical protein
MLDEFLSDRHLSVRGYGVFFAVHLTTLSRDSDYTESDEGAIKE